MYSENSNGFQPSYIKESGALNLLKKTFFKLSEKQITD